MAEQRRMTFAYADPPYLGCCALYEHDHGSDGLCWDDPTTHALLVQRLGVQYPDGWAMSASSPSLRTILPFVTQPHRIGAWVKTFVAFKKGVRPCYAWEPVIFVGGRNPNAGFPHAPPERGGKQNTPKDFFISEHGEDEWNVIASPITLKKGLTGAKPEAFCGWVLDLLNVQPGDTVIDVFPGTGVMGRVAIERTEVAA